MDVVFQVLHAKLTLNSELGDAVWARESTDMALQRQIVDAVSLVSWPGKWSVYVATVGNPNRKKKC